MFVAVALVRIILENIWQILQIPVAARSKEEVCGHSPAETVVSNPTGEHGCLCVVRYRSLQRADHSSSGVLPTSVRRCV